MDMAYSNKEFNKPLHCQHLQMHQYVKILPIVECLQSVQCAVYISSKHSHYKEKRRKDNCHSKSIQRKLQRIE